MCAPERRDRRRADRVRLRVAGVLLASALLVSVAAGAPRIAKPYARPLPEGRGRALVERSCLVCHSATLFVQQAKDSSAWERTLARMQEWGAGLAPAERDTLRGWLLANYGPRVAR